MGRLRRGAREVGGNWAVAVASRMRGGLVSACSRYGETRAGIRIDEGQFDGTDRAGVEVALTIGIPGLMSRRNSNFAGRSAEIRRLGWGN
jgi:hypothetical protein